MHHLHLHTLSRLNVYAWTEGYSVGVDLGGRALLVGKPGAVDSGSEGTLVGAVRNEDVLRFRVVVEFFVNWLVAEGGETGDIEGSAWGGGVGHIGGSGADAAGAKAREEGSAVVLLGDGHLEGIGEGDLLVYLRVESKWTGRERTG